MHILIPVYPVKLVCHGETQVEFSSPCIPILGFSSAQGQPPPLLGLNVLLMSFGQYSSSAHLAASVQISYPHFTA